VVDGARADVVLDEGAADWDAELEDEDEGGCELLDA
jgi:hypothetical protein